MFSGNLEDRIGQAAQGGFEAAPEAAGGQEVGALGAFAAVGAVGGGGDDGRDGQQGQLLHQHQQAQLSAAGFSGWRILLLKKTSSTDSILS